MAKEIDELLNGAELTDALLEQIVGGMTEIEESVIRKTVFALKLNGTTKERTKEIFALTEDPTLRMEALAYIDANWDTIELGSND